MTLVEWHEAAGQSPPEGVFTEQRFDVFVVERWCIELSDDDLDQSDREIFTELDPRWFQERGGG